VSTATKTTDHDTIRRWAEQRGGHPATVAATREGDEAISWEQEIDSGQTSRFFKLVRRD
jgi:hypothetical protein